MVIVIVFLNDKTCSEPAGYIGKNLVDFTWNTFQVYTIAIYLQYLYLMHSRVISAYLAQIALPSCYLASDYSAHLMD